MRKEAFFLIVICCAVLQATLLDYFRVFFIKPDLLLVCMVMANIFFSPSWALIFSAGAGFLEDSLTVTTFGSHTLIFVLWSLVIMRLSRKITMENSIIRVLLVLVIVVVDGLIHSAIPGQAGNLPSGIFFRTIIIEPVYTAIAGFFMFKIVQPYFTVL